MLEKQHLLHAVSDQNHAFFDIKQELITVLASEASSIQYVINNFPQNAEAFVTKILSTKGKVIFTGSGKSGLVAKKLTATFSSLGTAAVFLHPHDALHGDLGLIQPQDLVILFSKSASGVEFEYLLSFLKQQHNEHVLICCDQGPLVSKSNFTVFLPFQREACALNLAPTSSSTLMMAFGDALAIVVSKLKTFTQQDFARIHPAGALGKKLQQTVKNFMHIDQALPFVGPTTSFHEIITIINTKRLGLCLVVNEQKMLLGIITDGDVRRLCSMGPEIFEKTAHEIMTKTTKTITPSTIAGDALKYMEDFNITSLIVIDQGQVVGLVHIHDIIKAGLKG